MRIRRVVLVGLLLGLSCIIFIVVRDLFIVVDEASNSKVAPSKPRSSAIRSRSGVIPGNNDSRPDGAGAQEKANERVVLKLIEQKEYRMKENIRARKEEEGHEVEKEELAGKEEEEMEEEEKEKAREVERAAVGEQKEEEEGKKKEQGAKDNVKELKKEKEKMEVEKKGKEEEGKEKEEEEELVSRATMAVNAADNESGGEERQGSYQSRGTIVYSCNRITMCGGWADRQKGIVSAYVLSELMGRRFKLDMPRPCDISLYLAPNKVDWQLQPGEANISNNRSDVEGIDSHSYDLLKQMMKVEDLNQLPQLRARYVFITWNMELVHLLRSHPQARNVSWMSRQRSIADIYVHVLTRLFKPSPFLTGRLASLQGSRPTGSRLACAQIRVGDSSVFADSETFNSVPSVQKVIEHLKVYGEDSARYRVLFASDNVEVLKMAKRAFPRTFMESTGPVTHVDKYKGLDACAGLGRAILDQLMLSTCDVLIISESGLGKIAAFLRKTDERLFLFHDSTISAFRRDLPFPNRVYW